MMIYNQGELKIYRLPDGPLQTNSYWIDTGTVSCLIDPILDPDHRPVDASRLSLIVATHGHFDHIARCDDWRASFPVKLAVHSSEKNALVDPAVNCSLLIGESMEFYPAEIELHDQQMIQLDSEVQLQVIHTPGHTPGGICLLVILKGQPQALLTGDTLFAGSVGRVDIGGNENQLMQSLGRLVRTSEIFGQDLMILPGHGPETTMRAELESNPWLAGHTRFKPS